jgi:hypothetical protein
VRAYLFTNAETDAGEMDDCEPPRKDKKATARARPHFHNLYDTEQRSPFINSFLAAKQKYENVHLAHKTKVTAAHRPFDVRRDHLHLSAGRN